MSLPSIKLVSFSLCPFVQRSLVILHEKHVLYEVDYIDLADKPAWFLELSPLGKVPILVVDGEVLFESAVINEYLDEITPGSLHPEDPLQRAKHRAWIEFGSTIISSFGGFYGAADQQALDAAVRGIDQKLRRVEAELGDGPFFTGQRFSLVDAAYAPIFRYFAGLSRLGDFGFMGGTPGVRAWSEQLLKRESVQRCVGPDYERELAAAVSASSAFLAQQIG